MRRWASWRRFTAPKARPARRSAATWRGCAWPRARAPSGGSRACGTMRWRRRGWRIMPSRVGTACRTGRSRSSSASWRRAGPKPEHGAELMLDAERVRSLVRAALDEDLGRGDLTTDVIVPESARARGELVAKQELIVAGMDVARAAFQALDPVVKWEPEAREGDRFFPGTVMGAVAGRARALLTAERVALNFLQRMCGIATLTRRFVD